MPNRKSKAPSSKTNKHLVLFWPIAPGHGACPGICLIDPLTTALEKTDFSFCQQILHIASRLG